METTLTKPTPPGHIITQKSINDLDGHWLIGVLAALVVALISGVVNNIPYIGSMIVSGPFALGFAIFGLKCARGQQPQVENIFEGFRFYLSSLLFYLLFFAAFSIGLILLVVPGIIVACGFSQVFFILADDRDINVVDAFQKSWDMMKGRKMDYFLLGLRYFGWGLLSIFTLFIGLLWLYPYMMVGFANFYLAITDTEPVNKISDHLIEL